LSAIASAEHLPGMGGDESDESTLVHLANRMRDGDVAAFTMWAHHLHPLVYRVCRRLVNDRADAEDAVQDTFIRAWRSASALRDPAAHRGWLCQLARRACADRARGSITRVRPALELSVLDDLATDHGRPDQVLEVAQQRDEVTAAFAKLGERHRVILLLREVDELSYDEIAAALGLPRGTVESRLHRARAALGRVLNRKRTADDV
jgi:RNA polymerase sigma-70 factor, ECF subfamily